MSSVQANRLALSAARAVLSAAQHVEVEVEGKSVLIVPVVRPHIAWPRLSGGRAIESLDEAADGPWPLPVSLACTWQDGAIDLELRLNVWRQQGPYEGHLALQIVTVASNREIVWINLTKRIEDALEAEERTCAIPASFALWARSGERSVRPLTDALTRAAANAGLSSLSSTQFHVFDIELPAGDVRPSPFHAFRCLIKTALLKLPFVTRGEESDLRGNAPFSIEEARRRAAQTSASPGIPALDLAAAGGPRAAPLPPVAAEPPGAAEPAGALEGSVSSQENVFFDFIGCFDFGPFTHLEWGGMAKINVIVGENDTGKSHLLKLMYAVARGVEDFTSRLDSDRPSWPKVLAEKLVWTFEPEGGKLGLLVRRSGDEATGLRVHATLCNEEYPFSFGQGASSDPDAFAEVSSVILPQPNLHALFLPPKEVLTSLSVITLARERRMFGFDDTYVHLASSLRLEPVVGGLTDELQGVLDNLDRLLGGRIVTEQGKFLFVRGADKFGMSQTAEGIKKIGILARLIQNGELRRNSILFLDEPEVNLHPRAIRALVRMLFDLSRAGVQIFAATHSHFVLKEMEILARARKERVNLCSLARTPSGVEASFADLRDGLPETGIGREALAQYDDDVELTWKEGA